MMNNEEFEKYVEQLQKHFEAVYGEHVKSKSSEMDEHEKFTKKITNEDLVDLKIKLNQDVDVLDFIKSL